MSVVKEQEQEQNKNSLEAKIVAWPQDNCWTLSHYEQYIVAFPYDISESYTTGTSITWPHS